MSVAIQQLRSLRKRPVPACARNSVQQLSTPLSVRALSALCLGLGTMIGYRRIVKTLGEGIGKRHLTPAQGAASELMGAGLIASAGYTGLPVSTTHIITSGVAGTMVAAGSGINVRMLTKIALAWILTLPVTITVAACAFYFLN